MTAEFLAGDKCFEDEAGWNRQLLVDWVVDCEVVDLLSLLTVEEVELEVDFLAFMSLSCLFFSRAESMRVACSMKSLYEMPSKTSIAFFKSSIESPLQHPILLPSTDVAQHILIVTELGEVVGKEAVVALLNGLVLVRQLILVVDENIAASEVSIEVIEGVREWLRQIVKQSVRISVERVIDIF